MSTKPDGDKDVASKPVVVNLVVQNNIHINNLHINGGAKNPFASLWSWAEAFFVIFLSFFVIFL